MGQDYGRVVMEGEGIQAALERISEEIIDSTEDPGKLALVGIHSGGVFLANRIAAIISRKLRVQVRVGTLDITLYRDDWTVGALSPYCREQTLPFVSMALKWSS